MCKCDWSTRINRNLYSQYMAYSIHGRSGDNATWLVVEEYSGVTEVAMGHTMEEMTALGFGMSPEYAVHDLVQVSYIAICLESWNWAAMNPYYLERILYSSRFDCNCNLHVLVTSVILLYTYLILLYAYMYMYLMTILNKYSNQYNKSNFWKIIIVTDVSLFSFFSQLMVFLPTGVVGRVVRSPVVEVLSGDIATAQVHSMVDWTVLDQEMIPKNAIHIIVQAREITHMNILEWNPRILIMVNVTICIESRSSSNFYLS